jgi:hypothetical protein
MHKRLLSLSGTEEKWLTGMAAKLEISVSEVIRRIIDDLVRKTWGAASYYEAGERAPMSANEALACTSAATRDEVGAYLNACLALASAEIGFMKADALATEAPSITHYAEHIEREHDLHPAVVNVVMAKARLAAKLRNQR